MIVRACLGVGLIALVFAGCSGSDDSKEVPSNQTGQSNTGAPSGNNTPAASSTSTTPKADASTTTTPTTDAATTTEENCVPKGYAGNDKKIGAYCDNDTACPFQVDPFLICTVGHDPTNTHLFCTTPCSKDSECGQGAFCMKDTGGSGCVPTQCGGKAQ